MSANRIKLSKKKSNCPVDMKRGAKNVEIQCAKSKSPFFYKSPDFIVVKILQVESNSRIDRRWLSNKESIPMGQFFKDISLNELVDEIKVCAKY